MAHWGNHLLTNFFPTRSTPTTDIAWQGDEISGDAEYNDFRVMFHNVNGLAVKGPESFEMFIHDQSRIQVDIMGISEHCLDTTKFQIMHSIRTTARQHFPGQSLVQFHSSSEPAINTYKPGGTGLVLLGNVVSRLESNGRGGDPMGRWSYVHLHRRHQNPLTIISAYQVCKRPTNPIGNTAYHQQSRALAVSGRLNTNPRAAFITDLTLFITHLQQCGHDIILGGDFNESLEDKNSGILRLITQTNLSDPFLIKFPHHAPFGTHALGSRRIDAIYISPRLLESMKRIGYPPFQYTTNSDHRPIIIEFAKCSLFGPTTSTIQYTSPRIVQSKDKKNVAKFISHWYKALGDSQAFARQSTLDNDSATPSEAESIDQMIGRSAAAAEQTCQRRRPEFYSTTLAQQRIRVSILRGHYISLKTGKDRSRSLKQRMNRAGIDVPLPPTQNLTLEALKLANQDLRQTCQDHEATRQAELETKIDEAIERGHRNRTKILRAIKKVENNRRTYQTLKAMRQSNKESHNIDRIEIPESWPPPYQPIHSMSTLEDPKTCSQWKTISDPAEVEYYLMVRNRLHFGQAEGTPFTIPPLNTEIDWGASTETADSILHGTYTGTQTMPNCSDLLHACKAANELDTLPCEITADEFEGKIKSWRESTTTSPSGRHLGMYKALFTRIHQEEEDISEGDRPISEKQEAIVKLILSVLNYCLRNTHTLDRWKTVTNMMIFKEPGNFKIHRLRVIHIYEADFNLFMAVKWRQLIRLVDNNDLVNGGQYGGRPGCEAQSLTLLEELKYDLAHMTRRTLFNFDNDASSCYDRIVVPLASLVNRKYGLHRKVVAVHAQTLQEARFYLKTAAGISESYYSHCQEFPIHGTGQGSGNSPGIWLLISSTLFDIHHQQGHGAKFVSPDGRHSVSFSMVGFVDDSTGTCNHFAPQQEEQITELLQRMQSDAQLWNNLLYCSGGKLELPKCSFHVLRFKFRTNGQPVVCTESYDNCIHIMDQENNTTVPITYKQPYDPHKTLGHFKAPQSNLATELDNIKRKAQRVALLISASPITRNGAFLAYRTIYIPSIGYTLPQCFFAKTVLDRAQQQSIGLIISKCGYNRNTARALMYAPNEFAGGGFLPWYLIQGDGQVKHMIKHWRTDTIISKTMKVALLWAQWQSGHSKPILEDVHTPLSYLECRWVRSLRDFLSTINAKIRVDIPLVASTERQHDFHIMTYAIQSRIFSNKDLAILNYCRLYLHVTTISELFDATGTWIEPYLFQCQREPWFNPATYTTLQTRPGAYQIRTVWQRLCRQWCTSQGQLAASLNLGKWTQQGEALRRHRQTYILYTDRTTIYHWTSGSYWKYTRSHDNTKIFKGAQPTQWTPTEPCIPVKVVENADRTLTLHTRIHQPTLPPQIPLPKSFASYVLSLPQWEQCLLHGIHLMFQPHEIMHMISKLDATDSAVLVSDGSQRGDTMTFGWVFGSLQQVTYAEHSGQGYGTPSSHRAEGWGMLSGVLFIHHLQQYTAPQEPDYTVFQHLALFTDNQGLVTRITQRQQYSHSYPNTTLSPDWDIVEQIHATLKALPQDNIQIKWVKGHQDKDTSDLTTDAVYNIRADYLAGNVPTTSETYNPPPYLPAAKCHLVINDSEVTSHYSTAINRAYTLPALYKYLEQRHQWTPEIRQSIDWKAFSKAITQTSFSPTHLLKLVHNKLPTNSELAKTNTHHSAQCHYCTERETFLHLCQCNNPISRDFRAKVVEAVDHYLITRESPDLFRITFIICLEATLNNSTNPIPRLPSDARSCLLEQQQLGRTSLLSGFITQRWRKLHDRYSTLYNPDNDTSSDDILPRLIHTIWKSQHDFWQSHLKHTHRREAPKQPSLSNKVLEYRSRIRLLHAKRDQCLHGHREEYFHQDLDTYLQHATATQMRQYLHTYEPAILHSIKLQQANPLRSLFTFPGFHRALKSPHGPSAQSTQHTSTRGLLPLGRHTISQDQGGNMPNRKHTRWKPLTSAMTLKHFFLPKTD